jgi:hypothetical protein
LKGVILSDFEQIFNKTLGKYQRMVDKSMHRFYKRVYLGKVNAVVIKRKGLRFDSPKRILLQQLLNEAYLRNIGKIKSITINQLMGFERSKT